MLLTGHQPNYLPYLGFFHKIAQADAFLIVDTTQFVKRGPFGWIHRNRIRTAEGSAWLSVPIKTSGRFDQSIRDAEIDNREPWRRKHWRTLVQQYKKAPYFDRYAPFFEDLYEREWSHLAPLSEAIIRHLLECFGIGVPVHRLSELGVEGKAGELIINFCRALGSQRYLSGTHGRDYLDFARFEEAGIELVFHEFAHPVYPQLHGGEFVPFLCALDLLFNCGPDSRKILLSTEDRA